MLGRGRRSSCSPRSWCGSSARTTAVAALRRPTTPTPPRGLDRHRASTDATGPTTPARATTPAPRRRTTDAGDDGPDPGGVTESRRVRGRARLRARPVPGRALDALDDGRSVLVAAPTGSGKTIVAEYAIERALAAGAKAFYTTPLKALSNQKFGDLVRRHGRERVGLLTGDNSVNGEAPIVVMTTEVLRNMIYAASPTLEGLRYVVLDEVHYLQDRYRGAGLGGGDRPPRRPRSTSCASRRRCRTPRSSRTWIETVRGATTAVIEERRPVELRNLLPGGGAGDRTRRTCCPRSSATARRLRPNPEVGAARRPPRRSGARNWGGPASAPAARPAAHPEPGRDRRAARRRGDAPGDRVRLQPRRLRPGGRAVPDAPGSASRPPTSAPRSGGSPSSTPRARATTISTSSVRRDGSPGSRPGSPRTTPGWSRR